MPSASFSPSSRSPALKRALRDEPQQRLLDVGGRSQLERTLGKKRGAGGRHRCERRTSRAAPVVCDRVPRRGPMRELAPGLLQLAGRPRDAVNVYLAGDVLIDAGTRHARRRILRQIAGHSVTAHALTHAHPDHQGASHAVCTELGIPLLCGAGDADAMETPGGLAELQDPSLVNRLQQRFWTGPPHPVARRLDEGDEVAGFTVLEVPGHSPGHVAFWRESDRVLILGDVLNNVDPRTGRKGLREPLAIFTPDPARNRESIRRLAALEPALCCFGHGAAMRDPGALSRFAQGLCT